MEITSRKSVDESLAKFFYEQCAGTYAGHMANIPNNPTLFGLVRAYSGSTDTTASEFADFLRSVADQLKPLT